ncbi:MAG TPA: response regulator [Ktedonobacterales bacterium]
MVFTGGARRAEDITSFQETSARVDGGDRRQSADAPAVGENMATRETRDGTGTPRILIVDDEPEIRHSIRFLLEDAGYLTQEAPDGLAALEALRASAQPMVVLLDLMMPKLNGHGVLGVIAGNRDLTDRNRYIVMTAASRTLPLPLATMLTTMRITVITKPFDLDTLLDAVARAVNDLLGK